MSLFLLFASAAVAVSAPTFTQRPCSDARLSKIARCGTVQVAENREAPGGRAVSLNIIILPANSPAPDRPPLFDIDGGPGLAVTKNVGFYALEGAAYRARRDVVLIDQRGTGGSGPLSCPELSKPEDAYRLLYPRGAVARCRRALEGSADLRRYGTREAVADLDDVRAALGYDTIDLMSLSYGTTVALRYLATYPERVRAAVLMGVVPADAMPPRSHARAAERALKLLFARCKDDAACDAAFKPAADLKRALARFPNIDPSLPREIFTEKLRSLMYQPATARRIPFIVNRAAAGDLKPFYATTRPQGASPYFDGMYLSVVCNESMAAMDYKAAAAAARETSFGDYRLRRQLEACREWPSGTIASAHFAPVKSNAAVLLISGGLDPVTPPEWADQVAKTLPNSRHIVIPESGHVFDGLAAIDTCFDPLVVGFLDAADPKAIDASCLTTMQPPAFAIAEPAV